MNNNHKRVLEVYLDDIERKLREIQSEISPRWSEGVLLIHNLRPDIVDESRAGLQKGVSDMLTEIKAMKREYGLEAKEGSLRKHTSSTLLDVEVTLDELGTKNLENYGSLTQADKDRLEPEIANLLRILNGLLSVLAKDD